MPELLAKQLKTGTKESHSAAENTKFVGSFLKGVVEEENYRTLLKDFYFVYAAIEAEMERLKDDKYIAPIYFRELNRVESLKKDLAYYYGPDWNSVIAPSEGCVQYVERIHEVAEQNPYLLVGHHYTRYLGDLSGGQILKGIAEKALSLPVGKGLDFYDFPEIDDKKEFKTKYRSALDTLTTDSSMINAIIEEANFAFRLNMILFDELGEKGDWKSVLKVFVKRLTGWRI